jgi:hypothetical protein
MRGRRNSRRYKKNAARHARPPVIHFDQVKHRPRLVADRADALKRLRGGAAREKVGCGSLLPATATAMPTALPGGDFGAGFGRADYCRRLRERCGVTRKVSGSRFSGTARLRNSVSLHPAWLLRAGVRWSVNKSTVSIRSIF